MRTKKLDINKMILVLILTFFIIFLLVPLLKLFLHFRSEGIEEVFTEYIREALLNTLHVGIFSSFISTGIGFLFAYILINIKTRIKPIFSMILLVPMLVPTVAHGSGLILLFGNNGIITRFFNLRTSIYGFWGCVLGFILCTFPTAFIMFSNILKYEDHRQYEAADLLGINKLRQFSGITLPYISKSYTSIFCAIFALIITDYGIPLMIGGQYKTLALLMYNDVIGLSRSTGSSISILLLVITFIAFVIELKNRTRAVTHNTKYESCRYIDNRLFLWISKALLAAVTGFILLYIGMFLIAAFSERYPYDMEITFGNFIKTFNDSGLRYLRNSVVGALGTASFGTVLAYIFAYYSTRSKRKTVVIHILSICTAAIPGVVLGLGYVLAFKGSIIYGTLFILILINIVHFFAQVYLLAYNALLKINQNIETVAEVFGINKFKSFIDIILPVTYSTVVDMFSYFFVYSMLTISAVTFISNINIKPLSLMIPQYENQQQTGNVAVIVLAILFINILEILLTEMLKRRKFRS